MKENEKSTMESMEKTQTLEEVTPSPEQKSSPIEGESAESDVVVSHADSWLYGG